MTDDSVARMLDDYRGLIGQFTSWQMSADVFDVLDRLFADVDDYVDDPALRRKTSGIDGEELRARTRAAESHLSGLRGAKELRDER